MFVLVKEADVDFVFHVGGGLFGLPDVSVVVIFDCFDVLKVLPVPFLRGGFVVSGADLEDFDKGESGVIEGLVKGFGHVLDVAGEGAGDESRVKAEHDFGGVDGIGNDAVGGGIHGEAFARGGGGLAGGESVDGVVVLDECEGIIVADGVDEVVDAFGISGTVAGGGDGGKIGVGEGDASGKGKDAAVETVDSVAVDLVGTVAVATNVEAEHGVLGFNASGG